MTQRTVGVDYASCATCGLPVVLNRCTSGKPHRRPPRRDANGELYARNRHDCPHDEGDWDEGPEIWVNGQGTRVDTCGKCGKTRTVGIE